MAKYLIVHADDVGFSENVNRATLDAFENGWISSASLMPPTKAFESAVTLFKQHPEFDVGIHVTFTSEWTNCHWGPVSERSQVKSLLDDRGSFHRKAETFERAAAPSDVEAELDRQLARAFELGLSPSHADCHMFCLMYVPSLFEIYSRACKKFNLAPLASLSMPGPKALGVSNVDRVFMADPKHPDRNSLAFYSRAIDSMVEGLNVLLVHAGYDEPGLAHDMDDAVDWGASWRQADLTAISSPEFQEAIRKNKIQIIDWKHPAVKKAVR